jgi:hypothetical protein
MEEWLAGAGIAILTGFGLYYAISDWLQGEIALGLISFGSLVGIAVAYAFGYFWCLLEVLGGVSRNQSRTLLAKWSGFAFLATFIGVLTIEILYIRVIWVNLTYVDFGRAVPILLALAWLLPACVVASQKYLGWTIPLGKTTTETGWRARVRGAMRRFGSWLVALLSAKKALAIGGSLVLLSLILNVRSDIFGTTDKGYDIVAGTGAWWHLSLPSLWMEVFLRQVHRVFYVLGLAVAACALAGAITGRLARVIRGNGILCTLAGTIGLFEISDLSLIDGPGAPSYLRLGLWALLWVAPVAIWLGFARGAESYHNHARLAVMVYCLPIYLLGFAFLPFYTYLALGFGIFVVGMLLVWWGLVQSRWEVAQQQNPQ